MRVRDERQVLHQRRRMKKSEIAKIAQMECSGTGTSGAVVWPRTQVQPSHLPSVRMRVLAPAPELLQVVPSLLSQYFHQSEPLLPTPLWYQPSYSMPETKSPKE